MVVRDYSKLPPAIDHCQQAQMVVWRACGTRDARERVFVENVVAKQKRIGLVSAKHSGAGGADSRGKVGGSASYHELEQFGHRVGVLPNLLLGGGVQDCQAGIDVPFVAVVAH